MIITIQPLKKGYEIVVGNEYIFSYPGLSQFEVIEHATEIAEIMLKERGVRPVIKWLSIKHTPMKSKTASTNPGNKMSTASTDKSWRPAKKKAVAKAKKAIKKPTKK